ncbi:unnamed protein product [Caenorhabditis brenneri]
MDFEPNLPNSCLKNILKYVRFDQRSSIAHHIPAIASLESAVPLHLDYFHFEDLSLTIDTVSHDFYEFWNFPIPSPPSKKEVERIRDQKHFGNLFFRKIDLIGRWEKKVPLGITQGEAEKKYIDFLIGRFEKLEIRRLRIDDVDDFLRRIGGERKGKLVVEELHVKVEDYKEFEKICGFLNQESFPLKKFEIDAEKLDDLVLVDEKINSVMDFRINVNSSIALSEVLIFVLRVLSVPHITGSIFQFEVPDETFIRSILEALNEKFKIESLQLGQTIQIQTDQNFSVKVFGGQVEQYKRHIYDIMVTSYWWIMKFEF